MQLAFRLNAPQADEGGDEEGGNPFGSIGNHVAHPESSPSASDPALDINNNGSYIPTGNNYNTQPVLKHTSSLGLWLQQPLSADELKQKEREYMAKNEISDTSDPTADTLETITEQLGHRPSGNGKGGKEQPIATPPQRTQRWVLLMALVGILVLVALIVTVTVSMTGNGNDTSKQANDDGTGEDPAQWTSPPTPEPPTGSQVTLPSNATLGRIYSAGVVKCGVPIEREGFAILNVNSGKENDYVGIDVDVCKAVAAAIFGDAGAGRVEYIPVELSNRFLQLQAGVYDVLACTTTRTMEREVLEATTGGSFSFSIPYLYNGLQFAGLYPFVECADNLTVAEPECQDTRICAYDGSTHAQIIVDTIPNVTLVTVAEPESFFTNFIEGNCNVIAGEQFDLAEKFVRDRNYTGDYVYGSLVHSKEPISIGTRDGDAHFSDFVNWVVETLIAAEEFSITQKQARTMPATDVFGDAFSGMFRNVIAAVGNYGEMYERNLEALVPRPVADFVNGGHTGLIYSFPFGELGTVGNGTVKGGTMEAILKRGFLKCGISKRVIFASFNKTSKEWSGFDVDYCKALSAAIFDGVTDNIKYIDLNATERFEKLQSGEVDVLSRLTTVTLSRDVMEPSIGVGLSFSQPNFYDGMTFGGIPPYGECAHDFVIVGSSCQALKICVNRGTTFEEIVLQLFPSRVVVPRNGDAVLGLSDGACNAIAGGVADLSLTTVGSSGYDGPYKVASGRYSKDPLALVTRQDDSQWSKFVFWVVGAMFYAEEQGITRDFAELMPQVKVFGARFKDMFVNAVRAVGNYGEIYERNAQDELPRGGPNQLNEYLGDPQHYPLPGVF